MFTNKDVGLTTSRLVGSEEDAAPSPSETSEKPAAQPDSQKQPETKPKAKSKQAKPEEKSAEKEKPAEKEKTEEKKKPKEPLPVPGASFRAKLDRNHFLSYGYDSDTMVVMMDGDEFLLPSKEGANVVAFTAEGDLNVAGFVWPDNTEVLLRGTSYLIDEPTGRGHVIMFAGDPNYRFLWRASTQLFLNSILFAPSLR